MEKLLNVVDQLGALKEKKKELNATLKGMNSLQKTYEDFILQELEKVGEKKAVAKFFTATSQQKIASTEIDPEVFHDLLRKIRKASLFYDLVKVKVTEAKKFIGEAHLGKIWSVKKVSHVVVKKK